MKKMKKFLALFLSICLLAGTVAAFAQEQTAAEPTATEAETQATPVEELAKDTLLATVNGANVTYADAEPWYNSFVSNYGSYYDLTDPSIVRIIRAIALENAINEVLLLQKAKENGLDVLTAEEETQVNSSADADWQSALDSYVSYNGNLTDTSTDEEKAAAQAAALEYYTGNGYSQELLRKWYRNDFVIERARNLLTKDAAVTDEEVEQKIADLIAADTELYKDNVAAYEEYNNYVKQMEMYGAYYGSTETLNPAMYHPAGYRAIKHILLNVDETLMSKYTDLVARMEEQMDDEVSQAQSGETAIETEPTASAAADATPEPSQEPVTQADIDQAKADILASVAATVEEINQKLAAGESFDSLVEQYGQDPGMKSEPYKSSGYEVALESTSYDKDFVAGAFTVDHIGDVTAPILSSFGVHIMQYFGDVPEGPVTLTDAQREAIKNELLTTRQNELYNAGLDQWVAQADIVYTGVVPSMKDIEAEEAAQDEESSAQSETVEPTATPAA